MINCNETNKNQEANLWFQIQQTYHGMLKTFEKIWHRLQLRDFRAIARCIMREKTFSIIKDTCGNACLKLLC